MGNLKTEAVIGPVEDKLKTIRKIGRGASDLDR